MRNPNVLCTPERSKFLRTNNGRHASFQPGLTVALGIILSLYCGCGIAAAQAITRTPTINTIAGNGTAGFSGDSGLATGAELNGPYGVVVDSGNNVYIADPGNNRIRKVAAGTGVVTTIAGDGTAGYSGDNGPATSAELNLPTGVAVDSGETYISRTRATMLSARSTPPEA